MQTPTKLETVVTKDAPFVGLLPEGAHVVTLNYKTDKDTGIKKPSESWMLPKLAFPETLVASEVVIAGFRKFVDDLQVDGLRELAAGDVTYSPIICNLESLLKDYATDARGERTGLKQSVLNDWITYTLVPFMAARIKANLVNQTAQQQQDLLASYSKKFKLAATKGNRAGNETLSDAGLQDLAQRLVTYTSSDDATKNLPASEALDAIVARIQSHRDAIAKANAEVNASDF